MRQLILAITFLLPVAVGAVELHNELGDDQRSETISVEIDGRAVGTLHVDGRRPEAALALPVTGERHRYRISGHAVMDDGTRVAIAGGGLILRQAAMDRIGEAGSAIQAIAALESVLSELKSAAPEFPIDTLRVQRGPVASESELAAAERRLGRALPQGYREFVLKHGSLHMGSADEPQAAVFAPAQVQTLEEFVLGKARENDIGKQQIDEMRKFIGKRFPEARRDLVLDVWEREYPAVIRAQGRCPKGELPYAFPESQWEVLMATGLDDNPFMGIVSYENDIVGETQCMGFERELAFALHDHLYEEADDVLYLLGADEDSIRITRGDLDDGQPRLWFHFDENDE